MKVRIKPRIIDVIEDDGRYLDKDMTYYDKEDVEPLDELPEGLDEAAEEYARLDDEGVWKDGGKYKGFIAGAEWQKVQDQKTIELAEEHAMLAGMNKMEQQMLENAVERAVKVDAGGYPYIDAIELFDYTEDKPIFNPGDIVIVNIRKKEGKK
ncbi:MAG: hypothetical protein J6T35_02210 [Bacteroidales bacterium]|nr:hypothetical protein [Bacteroidales bacterium]